MTSSNKSYNLASRFTIITFIFFMYMFLIKPGILSINDTLNTLYNMISMACIFFIVILYIKRGKISQLQKAIVFYILCLGVSTFFGTRDFNALIKNYSVVLGISLFTELLINDNLEEFLKAISNLISLYIIINFFTVILTDGFSNHGNWHDFYFLGYDNASVQTVVLGLFVLIISSHYFHNKMTFFTLSMIAVGALTFYFEWAASCLVCISLLIFYVAFIYKKDYLKKFLNFKVLLTISFLFFIIFVILRWQNVFSYLIINVLHKDLTFTNRLAIWDNCLFYIKIHPILGLGVQNVATRLLSIGIYHAHSGFLNILLEGGIIGFVAFLNLFKVATKNLTVKENKRNEFSSMCTFALFIYLISTLVEVIMDDYLFYIILNLCYYIPLITSKKNERELRLVENINNK